MCSKVGLLKCVVKLAINQLIFVCGRLTYAQLHIICTVCTFSCEGIAPITLQDFTVNSCLC